ncbi:Crp/Fnr family transcriptional regulator [Pararhodospirillum photometricum]|uniref:cAMP-binding protein-catabolite gene activator and regulatory subunit of cAMP-dependent protein kinase n=1 Tax=Pararhodospirillum photometricum DSM 122 TaxID=1150469 RepID=H6SIU8_PARPM|nr:Crp/Fnr family transcriptional regulator [Pararhodospirillum photometricum]CCG06725.1 cAMP-binding protein-catabolite gene activator and regulatory subunit of cAMP-dependent protein kinase [Pararhodospirillum photometricum DSM 122]
MTAGKGWEEGSRVLECDPLLATLPEPSRKAVLALGRFQTIRAGKVLLHFGEPSDGLYCIVSGQFRMTMLDANGTEVLASMGLSGTWVGGATVVDNSVTLIATTAVLDSEVFFIPVQPLQRLMHQDPEIALFLARMALFYLRISLRRVLDGATLTSKAMLARMLLYFYTHAQSTGQPEPEVVHLSQEDLATMSGVSRRTASRILQAMRRAGSIEIDYHQIRIVCPDRLGEDARDRAR